MHSDVAKGINFMLFYAKACLLYNGGQTQEVVYASTIKDFWQSRKHRKCICFIPLNENFC